MHERGGNGEMVGDGEGGQTRDGSDERPRSQDSYRRPMPATYPTMPSIPAVKTPRATGLDTLTMFSANHPRTVTLDGPISQQTASEPSRSITRVGDMEIKCMGTHRVYFMTPPNTQSMYQVCCQGVGLVSLYRVALDLECCSPSLRAIISRGVNSEMGHLQPAVCGIII